MRDSFVVYTEWGAQFELLTDKQRSDLIMAIFDYQREKPVQELDAATSMAFSFIKAALDRDAEKWEEVREKRREAGKLGGRPKKQTKAKKAKGFSEKQKKQNKAKKAVYVNVNENVNENVINKSPLDIALDDFKEHRRQLKAPMTDQAYKMLLNKLEKLSGGNDQKKTAILYQSIENGWKGVFELKGKVVSFNNHPQRAQDSLELERKLLATN